MFGLERGFCLMIGGEDDIVAHLDPVFRTIAPGLGDAGAHARPHRRPVHQRAGLPALRPGRRRPLREDGAQRHRVRAHGGLRRGPQHPQGRRRRHRRRTRSTPRPPRCASRSTTSTTSTPPRSPRCGGGAAWWRRGCSTSPPPRWSTTRSWRRSRAGCPTRARAGGRRSPPSTRASPRRCSRRRSYSRFSSRGQADFGDKVLSAMRKQFGGHDEKQA